MLSAGVYIGFSQPSPAQFRNSQTLEKPLERHSPVLNAGQVRHFAVISSEVISVELRKIVVAQGPGQCLHQVHRRLEKAS